MNDTTQNAGGTNPSGKDTGGTNLSRFIHVPDSLAPMTAYQIEFQRVTAILTAKHDLGRNLPNTEEILQRGYF